ncbi:hypothetical protein GA0070609_0027 [Micromonospora echinaurantiaca]|uniref:CopC domain-containing protein n=1 Tax=Micromonospora echinaurantiaca TaxID=47857 RepID=A0A1C5GPE2_9ACTN|nr:hypothetical protein [Micromonospora echinaurantiaca]SCG34981.1 hypothetical protein GA0070609_0027 [Micromonospora echinaurantiaca]
MTRTWQAVAAALVGLALAFLSTAPAAAHTGKLKLTVAGDGADGVTVQAVYADGHRLDKVVRLTLTATGPDGRRVGPVQLEPAAEGQGFYASGPILSPGRWQVTVSAPAPHRGEASAEVEARNAQSPPPAPAPVAPAAGTRDPAGDGGVGWWPLALAGLGLAVLAAVAVPLVRRRRA